MEQTAQQGYVKLLTKPIPPGVDNLQRWIEDAWDLGVSREMQVIMSLINTRWLRLRHRRVESTSTTTTWDTQVDRHRRYLGHTTLKIACPTIRQQSFTSHSSLGVSRRSIGKRVDHRHSPTSRCELVDFHSDEIGVFPE